MRGRHFSYVFLRSSKMVNEVITFCNGGEIGNKPSHAHFGDKTRLWHGDIAKVFFFFQKHSKGIDLYC